MKKIQTTDFLLRPYKEDDKKEIRQINFAPDFMEMVGWDITAGKFSSSDAEEWYKKKTDPEYTWAIEVDGKLTGSVWIHSIEKKTEEQGMRSRYTIVIIGIKALEGK